MDQGGQQNNNFLNINTNTPVDAHYAESAHSAESDHHIHHYNKRSCYGWQVTDKKTSHVSPARLSASKHSTTSPNPCPATLTPLFPERKTDAASAVAVARNRPRYSQRGAGCNKRHTRRGLTVRSRALCWNVGGFFRLRQ